jgi:hypothetical protein
LVLAAISVQEPAKHRDFPATLRQQFTKVIKGDLKAARHLVKMAEDYFASEGGAESEKEFMGVTEEAKRCFGSNWPKKIDELNALCRGGQ